MGLYEQLTGKTMNVGIGFSTNPANYPVQPLPCLIEVTGSDLTISPAGNHPPTTQAFFLPWQPDSGLYLDLPKTCPENYLFITSVLSGCSIGVADMGPNFRIKHYNQNDLPFTEADLKRYGENVKWLLPDKYQPLLGGCAWTTFYRHTQGVLDQTFFWGEQKRNGWEFYYKELDKTNILRF